MPQAKEVAYVMKEIHEVVCGNDPESRTLMAKNHATRVID